MGGKGDDRVQTADRIVARVTRTSDSSPGTNAGSDQSFERASQKCVGSDRKSEETRRLVSEPNPDRSNQTPARHRAQAGVFIFRSCAMTRRCRRRAARSMDSKFPVRILIKIAGCDLTFVTLLASPDVTLPVTLKSSKQGL